MCITLIPKNERDLAMPLMTLPEAEKRQILAALQATNWRIYGPRGAARLLGIGPEKLRYRMRKYGLKRPKATS